MVHPPPRPHHSKLAMDGAVANYSDCIAQAVVGKLPTPQPVASAMATDGDGSLDIVVFPWLAFGHMIPYLELSKRLAARGHTVTFLSAPRNLARLPPVPAHLAPCIRFVSLPLPAVDGLPEGVESTADVPPGKDEILKKACDGLAAPFAAFLANQCAGGRKPDWIINDFCHHWLHPIADEHKVPCAAFLSSSVAFITFQGPRDANAEHPRLALGDFTIPPKWIPFPSTIAHRRHEAAWIAASFHPNASGVSDMERLWQIFERSRLTIYRSCPEVEPRLFTLLTDLLRRPAIPAGALLPPDIVDNNGSDKDKSLAPRSEVLRWLDGQPLKSVIYVALGSEAPLTIGNLHELALGLELAGVRFIWALRKPAGMFNPDGDEHGLLPNGFEERTQERGVVAKGWVPQVKVLAHGAVGAFLTHCGWGSIIESFVFGHPLVMLPFVVDQGVNAQAMAEKGIGVEVARDENDGSFDRNGVGTALRRVMVEDEGKVFASNAKKLQEVVADQGRQDKYMDELVEYLRSHKGA